MTSSDDLLAVANLRWNEANPRARPLFDDGSSGWWLNACINYGPPDFAHIRGYKEAADALVRLADARTITLDYAVYPICFLYRHYLELSLKALIRDFDIYHDDKVYRVYLEKPNHDIQSLWSSWLAVLEAADHDTVQLRQHSTLVRELHSVDSCSMSFRYQKTMKGKQALADGNGKPHEDVAVDSLARRMQELAGCLDYFDIMIMELAAQERRSL